MWVVTKYFKCNPLTEEQKGKTPCEMDDVLVIDAGADGITSAGAASGGGAANTDLPDPTCNDEDLQIDDDDVVEEAFQAALG